MASKTNTPSSSPFPAFALSDPAAPRFHKYYVGIDVGYKFHVAACIPCTYFLDPKEPWKRVKTLKLNSESQGLGSLLEGLKQVSSNPKDFFILLEPTGGHYGYTLMKMLMDAGYDLFQVDNKAVKHFRESDLGIKEKSDDIDARVMAYMGFHKALHPSMKSVRLVTPATPTMILFRTLVRDRWLLNQQLTRRKNQIQQLFAVTNPEFKHVFTQPSRPTVLKLALQYPTAHEIAQATQEEIRKALLSLGARSVANKASTQLKELITGTPPVAAPHLVARQTWLIQDALHIIEAIDHLDEQIHVLLFGDPDKGVPAHPYTEILFSFPIMSDTWACTLIGVIGDVERFGSFRQFKKYLGFSAENAKSGISVDRTRLTYDGVRDTRRVLFQMAMTLLSPKSGPSVFKAHYDQLTQGRPAKDKAPMAKMKAMGHVCGKLANVIYSCLKTGQKYDPRLHAQSCGVENYLGVDREADNEA